MSHYANLQTNITDIDALVAALCRMENGYGDLFQKAHIEVHTKPVKLKGYYSTDKAQLAHVVIREGNGSSWADMGFSRGKDGKFTLIYDDMDKHLFNKEWMGKLTTYYGVEKTKIELDAKGIKYKEGVDASNGNCPTIEAFFEAAKPRHTAANFFDS
jgi:hypothetical protein